MSELNSERRGPTGLRQLDTVEELYTVPDGTVVVWYSQYGREYERQAGVLVTASDGTREIRPISIYVYESNNDLTDVTAPLWVLTFDDPPAGVDLFAAFGIADVESVNRGGVINVGRVHNVATWPIESDGDPEQPPAPTNSPQFRGMRI